MPWLGTASRTNALANETNDASRASSDEGVELSEDIRHGIAKVLQRLNYGRELEHLNIAKEYGDGRIGILVELQTHPARDGRARGWIITAGPADLHRTPRRAR